jgi:hypothetical protein
MSVAGELSRSSRRFADIAQNYVSTLVERKFDFVSEPAGLKKLSLFSLSRAS